MMAGVDNGNPVPGHEAGDAERLARQRKRSIAIALSLGALVVLFYVATLVKMSGDEMRLPGKKAPATSGAPAKQ